MDDAELVRQVLQGNRGAYAHLVKRYTPKIAALCRAHVRHKDVVEDLVQETFFRGLDRLVDLHEPEKFGPWLYTSARRLCWDWLNDPDNQKRNSSDDLSRCAATIPADNGNGQDRMAKLKKCISRLPVELREVIQLYYGGDRVTYNDMAVLKGVSPGQVNKLLTTARKKLRACMEAVE
jgi:RNA polymerase sigma factor (sigma-70 family)